MTNTTFANDGLFSHAIGMMKDLYAASATFQQLVGADNATQAKGFIFEGAPYTADDPNEEITPPDGARIIISVGDDVSFEGNGTSGFSVDMGLEVSFELGLPRSIAKTFSEMYTWLLKYDGLILREILVECRTNPSLYPDINSLSEIVSMGVYEYHKEQGFWSGGGMRRFGVRGSAMEAF